MGGGQRVVKRSKTHEEEGEEVEKGMGSRADREVKVEWRQEVLCAMPVSSRSAPHPTTRLLLSMTMLPLQQTAVLLS